MRDFLTGVVKWIFSSSCFMTTRTAVLSGQEVCWSGEGCTGWRSDDQGVNDRAVLDDESLGPLEDPGKNRSLVGSLSVDPGTSDSCEAFG